MAICRYPNEKLTRKQALKGMTLDAAYASFQEHDIGSLQVGKKADFVVFDRDFVGCEDEEICDGSEILEAKVKAVVIDGMVAWGKLPRSEIWKVIHELFGKLITRAIRSSVTPLRWCEILRSDVLKCTIVTWISWKSEQEDVPSNKRSWYPARSLDIWGWSVRQQDWVVLWNFPAHQSIDVVDAVGFGTETPRKRPQKISPGKRHSTLTFSSYIQISDPIFHFVSYSIVGHHVFYRGLWWAPRSKFMKVRKKLLQMCTRPRETSTKLDVEGVPSDQVSSPEDLTHEQTPVRCQR